MSHQKQTTYNFRKELARQIRCLRSSIRQRKKIDMIEAWDNVRTLIGLCDHATFSSADELFHLVVKQLTKYASKKRIQQENLADVSNIKYGRVQTRRYVLNVQLPKNYVG